MPPLSRKLEQIKPSVTLAITARAQELKKSGVDVVSLSAGEPDFDTPVHIRDAAKKALDEGLTRYTPEAGMPTLRQAVAAQSEAVRGVACASEQVIITVGAKHALFNFFQVALEPGDEVIVPAPYWVSYPDQVLLAGGRPVIVPTTASTNFLLDPERLKDALTPRTKVIVINSPSNPSGMCYTRAAYDRLFAVLAERNIWLLCDEIYRSLIYGAATHVSPLSLFPDKDRVFVVDGVSKSYAMTGWRIGWGIGHPEVIKAMGKIQGQSTSNATTMAQAASIAAITGPTDFLVAWRAEYQKRRDAMVQRLNAMRGVQCVLPEGAFYALPDVRGVLSRTAGWDDVQLSSFLLDEAHVAVVPGSAFGATGHIRLSYATSLAAIEKALDRMQAAFERL